MYFEKAFWFCSSVLQLGKWVMRAYCAPDSQDTWTEHANRDASSKVEALCRQGTPWLTDMDESCWVLQPW